MTNTNLLRIKIDQSGYKMKYVATRIGLTYQGFLNKLRNKSEFTASEVSAFSWTLMSMRRRAYFFAADVD